MYGEAWLSVFMLTSGQGLSPRVRGSLGLEIADAALLRSIPACTGKPRAAPTLSSGPEVYPRVYGEALE